MFEIYNKLKEVENFRDKFQRTGKCKIHGKNSVLLQEGASCNSFVFLKSGVVRHAFLDRNGKDITKNFMVGPCFLFYSLSSYVSDSPSQIECETITDVELFEVNRAQITTLLQQPHFSEFWNHHLITYIQKKEQKELSLLKDTALERYNLFLKEYPNLLNLIPHYYIASYLSISPETLSRVRRAIS